MEFSEDSMDRTLVFKGKRSKRPRQFMAIAMVTSTSSTGGGAGGGGADGGISGGDDVYNYSSSIQNSSSTTSTTQISTSSTEEDEDMANCLILLAQSGRCQKLQVESTERKMMKISSRKFTEMATTTTGKAGFYVYECKTCNRTFSSFQALGGHRTSHKKIKIVTEEKKSTADSVSPSINHHQQQQQQEEKINRIITASVTSTQINKGNSNSHSNLINNKPKIHECSICGAEFSSGQALGGHMRRHRPPTITPTNTKINIDETSNNTSDSSHNDDQNSKEKPKIFLSLDLNLPASPEDDHQRDTNNFEFSANQQNLVFSAAALVDCHY